MRRVTMEELSIAAGALEASRKVAELNGINISVSHLSATTFFSCRLGSVMSG
jgi:hypothetical protein